MWVVRVACWWTLSRGCTHVARRTLTMRPLADVDALVFLRSCRSPVQKPACVPACVRADPLRQLIFLTLS
eukprot:12879397-Alexandrium_andersonii.AAC.1